MAAGRHYGSRRLWLTIAYLVIATGVTLWVVHTERRVCRDLSEVSRNQEYVLRHHLIGASPQVRTDILERIMRIKKSQSC